MSVATELQPGDIALRLTGRDYVSWSAITCYQTCPLRYPFRYVEALPDQAVSANLVFGSAIHQAAERHYRELLAGNPAPSLDQLLAAYAGAWRERESQPVQFGKGDDCECRLNSVARDG